MHMHRPSCGEHLSPALGRAFRPMKEKPLSFYTTLHVESICLQPAVEPSALRWKSRYLSAGRKALGLEPWAGTLNWVELKALD